RRRLRGETARALGAAPRGIRAHMTTKLGPSKPCPCTSGKSYGDCCRPLHRNEREAKTAEALMRCRYVAFALGEVAYFSKTHVPDDGRRLTEIELREACR